MSRPLSRAAQAARLASATVQLERALAVLADPSADAHWRIGWAQGAISGALVALGQPDPRDAILAATAAPLAVAGGCGTCGGDAPLGLDCGDCARAFAVAPM